MTIKKNVDLKPCPFCGGVAVNVDYYAGFYVKCAACKAKTATYNKEYEAVAAWENRVAPEKKKE